MKAPRIDFLIEKKLLGMKMEMCFAQHAPFLIWQKFMPRKKEITQLANSLLYSLEVYPDSNFFRDFNVDKKFEQWAAVEVNSYEQIPESMQPIILKEGAYAVFTYKGKSSNAKAVYDYILGEWLPTSGYELNHLPHFAVMGEKYQNDDPESEEEIWIPIISR